MSAFLRRLRAIDWLAICFAWSYVALVPALLIAYGHRRSGVVTGVLWLAAFVGMLRAMSKADA